MSITEAVVTVELKVTLAGDTLQLDSDGKPEHCGTRLNVPVSPLIAVSISMVLPDWPGFEIVIVDGLAAIEKSGAAVTVNITVPDEPEYVVSP